jgi:hypothetical protein
MARVQFASVGFENNACTIKSKTIMRLLAVAEWFTSPVFGGQLEVRFGFTQFLSEK